MIRYTLRCDRGHGFESWFQSSSAYDSQVKRKLVSCPNCGSTKVEKAIMAPQIAKKGRAPGVDVEAAAAPAPTEVSAGSTPLMLAQAAGVDVKGGQLKTVNFSNGKVRPSIGQSKFPVRLVRAGA